MPSEILHLWFEYQMVFWVKVVEIILLTPFQFQFTGHIPNIKCIKGFIIWAT